jgi:pimeloyl-ACP methyl ester carboxylesterase
VDLAVALGIVNFGMIYYMKSICAVALLFVSAVTFSQTVTSKDGVKIAYSVQGQGEPALVFVHGWSCDKSYWSAQVKPFSYRFKVVTLDLAGHGQSGATRKDYTIKSYGADVAAVVNKLGLKKVVLIGHSMGGDVIAEAARSLPGKVAGLVMVDSYKEFKNRSREEVDKMMERFQGDDFKDQVKTFVKALFVDKSNPALVEKVSNDMASAPKNIAVSSLQSSLDHNREMPRLLQELKLPVFAINADTPPTDMNSMKLYDVQVLTMSGVGHFLMMENPEGFNKILNRALDKVVN